MSKKNKETEEILEEDALNEDIQTLADEPTVGVDDDATDDSDTTGDSSEDLEDGVETDEEESVDATEIPSNFNLSYFLNHYGYIEQKSFTSYIKQLEGDSSDSGDGTDGDDGGSDGGGNNELG